jgi:succinoglycan biosynthesis protein ExoV
MQLYYWSTQGPNLGDALNPWLWPRLLPNFFDDDPRELFIGIGSNFGHPFSASAKKIVCGNGYAGYQPHRRSTTTGTSAHQVGRTLPEPGERHPVGFMPHWESALHGAWEEVCGEAGATFIDPRGDVEEVIAAMRGCDLLVTEAMHGAIVADALRVPWVPFMPLPAHRFKWFDWAESQGIELQFRDSARSTWLEFAHGALEGRDRLQAFVCVRGQAMRSFGSGFLRARAASAIAAAAASRPYLTARSTLEATTDAMLVCLENLCRHVRAG